MPLRVLLPKLIGSLFTKVGAVVIAALVSAGAVSAVLPTTPERVRLDIRSDQHEPSEHAKAAPLYDPADG